MSNTEEMVKGALVESLGVDASKIKNGSKLVDDLGMDSFGAVELGFALETKSGIKINQEEMQKINKVSDIISFINKRKKE